MKKILMKMKTMLMTLTTVKLILLNDKSFFWPITRNSLLSKKLWVKVILMELEQHWWCWVMEVKANLKMLVIICSESEKKNNLNLKYFLKKNHSSCYCSTDIGFIADCQRSWTSRNCISRFNSATNSAANSATNNSFNW